MNIEQRLLALLDAALGLHGRTAQFTLATPLLGSVPELDSMASLAVLTAMEEQFDVHIDDDEIDGAIFATVGTLAAFVERKVGA